MSETFAELTQRFSDLVDLWYDGQDLYFDWMSGVVGGGPNGDGRYPLRNRAGETTLVLCPAAQAAQFISTGYQAQIGFDAALAAAEQFQTLLMPANVRFQDDFVGCIGKLRGDAPSANLVINIRHYLANLTGGTVIGSITIATNRAVTFSTTGSGVFDVDAGAMLVFEGPATALAATKFVAIMKAAYR